MRSYRLVAAATAAVALLCAANANAQNQGAATAGETFALEEIIVTAQRRSENLQKVAVAISAVGGDDLATLGISETTSLTRMVPALQIQPAGGGSTSFFLRGVGTIQSNSFGENPIAFNFNGVYLARPAAPVGSFYDLERVEVVKGPQGTLYGRNATGGAINVLPKAPRMGETSGNVSLEYGNYDTRKAQGALNVDLGDKAALRIAAQVVDRHGYLSDGYDDEKGEAARLSFLLEPDDVWSLLVLGDYFHQGGKGVGSVLAPGAYVPGAPSLDDRVGGADPRSLAALSAWSSAVPAPPFCAGGFVASGCVAPPQTDGYVDSDFYGVSATLQGEFDVGSVTVIPAYRRSEPDYRFYFPGFRGEVAETVDQYSLEARFASPTDLRFRYVVGAYYFQEEQSARNYFDQGLISRTHFTPQLETESGALFGQATLDVADGVRLVGGVRYTEETRKQSTAISSAGLPGPVEVPLGVPFPGRLKVSKATWKGGLEWDAGERSLVYVNVATGFKAGGFFVAAPPNNTFSPENLTAYTAGTKNRFLDGRLQLNLEAFYWDYRDQQISYVGGIRTETGLLAPGGVTVNAGKAAIYGLEAEMEFALTRDDTLTANVQYMDGEYDSLRYTALSASGGAIRSGCAATDLGRANPTVANNFARLFQIDCSGKQTVNSPKWTANLTYQRTFTLDGDHNLVFGARTRLESSRYVTIDYLPETRQGSYMMSDAYLTLEGVSGGWSLTGYVNNIENETVLAGATVRPVLQTVYSALRPPRTYGLRATFNF